RQCLLRRRKDRGQVRGRSDHFGTCVSRLRTASGSISCASGSDAVSQPVAAGYQYWDGDAGRDRDAREYVPRSELSPSKGGALQETAASIPSHLPSARDMGGQDGDRTFPEAVQRVNLVRLVR